jgi:hypothetical protein
MVKIPSDDEFKVRTDLMEEAICKDLEAGKKPFAMVGFPLIISPVLPWPYHILFL